MKDLLKGKGTLLLGLLVCLAVAIVAWAIPNYKLIVGVSSLLWAFIFSIIITNSVKVPIRFKAGIDFCSSYVLKFSIAMLGLTISAVVWIQMGFSGLFIILLVVALALSLGILLGRKCGLSNELSTLIGVGTCICGASAIAATGPVIRAREEEMGVALACVTLFGVLAMALYPFLFTSTVVGGWLHNSEASFGVWCGVGIHDTAQVLAAAHQVGATSLSIATVTKSIRIFLIAPMIILAPIICSRMGSRVGTKGEAKKWYIPWYAVAFVAGTVINSILLNLWITQSTWSTISSDFIKPIVVFLFTVAFAGVGFKVKFQAIRKVGLKAFAVGLICALITSVVGLALVIALV